MWNAQVLLYDFSDMIQNVPCNSGYYRRFLFFDFLSRTISLCKALLALL